MALLENTITELVKFFLNVVQGKIQQGGQSKQNIQLNLNSHLKEVASWSGRIQYFGMSEAEDTDNSSIPLDISTVPRKFSNINTSKKVKEEYLLNDRENYLILGAPGSGKTTTIKRLARLILLNESVSTQDDWQFPVVVRLRKMTSDSSLFSTIADIVGLKYEIKTIERKREITKDYNEREWDKSRKDWVIVKKRKKEIVTDTIHETYIGNDLLEDILPELLDEVNAIVFLDGFDEISIKSKTRLRDDIEKLSLRTPNCKIIVSCRSGDYDTQLEGFNVFEICPLGKAQIHSIVEKWVSDHEKFIEELNSFSVKDLTTSPLFLTQLIVLFRNNGYLPSQPSSVCKKFIELLLDKWDKDRKIIRISAYSHFESEAKIEFLSILSYYLTYKYKIKSFKTEDLVAIYKEICHGFNLPENEALDVAREIETHTGVIAESADESFEFSHLSLQEYLCANYLVRDPMADFFINYLVEYPAPIAVAASLSSNPSNWLATIIFDDKKFHLLTQESTISLLSRLIQERPYFSVSELLGLAIVRLIMKFQNEIFSQLEQLLSIESIKRSFSQGLSYYRLQNNKNDQDNYWLEQVVFYKGGYGFYSPQSGYVPRRYIDGLVNDSYVEKGQYDNFKSLV